MSRGQRGRHVFQSSVPFSTRSYMSSVSVEGFCPGETLHSGACLLEFPCPEIGWFSSLYRVSLVNRVQACFNWSWRICLLGGKQTGISSALLQPGWDLWWQSAHTHGLQKPKGQFKGYPVPGWLLQLFKKLLVKQKLKPRAESALKVLHFAPPHEPSVS